MATDSWALAVDEQEAAAESLGTLQIIDEKPKVEANGTDVKPVENAETKPDDEDKEDKAAQSLLNKLIRSNLVNTTNQVEVLQRDPNSPLYSVKSFEELRLKPQLLQGVYAMGFNRPSKIQENALPMMLAEPPQNLIAQSQSGTGKTAAFVLAMLSHVDPARKYPQTGKVIEQMGKSYTEVKLAYAVRGNKLERGMKIQEQIVIGTPGTVLDWCAKLKFIDAKKIKVFVLDEADVMIATQGHQDQSIRVQSCFFTNTEHGSCSMLSDFTNTEHGSCSMLSDFTNTEHGSCSMLSDFTNTEHGSCSMLSDFTNTEHGSCSMLSDFTNTEHGSCSMLSDFTNTEHGSCSMLSGFTTLSMGAAACCQASLH
ncbi:UNVERIFIED_CONTAM: hypothetical protein FKN15_067844 [Acipenser sinensis]